MTAGKTVFYIITAMDTITENAPTAVTQETIDGFVKRNSAIRGTEDFTQVKETATTLSRLGFGATANSRYVEFLEAFHSEPALTAAYAERYPACYFLPWKAFHATRRSLKLSLDVAANYAGAVPPDQVTMLDIFELQEGDLEENPAARITELLELDYEGALREWEQRLQTPQLPRGEPQWPGMGSLPDMVVQRFTHDQERERRSRNNQRQLILGSLGLMQTQFFVLAPPEAFTKAKDFIARVREGMDDMLRPTIAPNDPLVVRFVKGGCLVVAAWGDEAAWLNDAVKDITL